MSDTKVAQRTQPDKWGSVQEFAEELGLEPARQYMLAGNGAGVRLHQLHWPRKKNCTKYDRWVYVLEFSDGTFTQMLDTCALTKGQAMVHLLDMAEASTP